MKFVYSLSGGKFTEKIASTLISVISCQLAWLSANTGNRVKQLSWLQNEPMGTSKFYMGTVSRQANGAVSQEIFQHLTPCKSEIKI